MFIATEETANPARIRFVPDCPVLDSSTAGFLDAETSARSPLAQKLFAIDGVKAVFLDTQAITVVVNDQAKWPMIKILTNGAIMEHFGSGEPVIHDKDKPMPRPGIYTNDGRAIQALFEQSVNPQVASHGGKINLIDVQEDVVFIRMDGACQGCSMADVTLKQGVEKAIMDMIPAITAVLDTTDHASGTNPYQAPAKGAPSPFQ